MRGVPAWYPTEARRVSKFMVTKLKSILDEKKAVEHAKQDLDFQLTEARRVSKFMETKLQSVLEEKKVDLCFGIYFPT